MPSSWRPGWAEEERWVQTTDLRRGEHSAPSARWVAPEPQKGSKRSGVSSHFTPHVGKQEEGSPFYAPQVPMVAGERALFPTLVLGGGLKKESVVPLGIPREHLPPGRRSKLKAPPPGF